MNIKLNIYKYNRETLLYYFKIEVINKLNKDTNDIKGKKTNNFYKT